MLNCRAWPVWLFCQGDTKLYLRYLFNGKDEFTLVTIDSTTGNKYIETCIQLK